MRIPSGFEKWNPAMRGAYSKGYAAGLSGADVDSCPYDDKRKDCGRLTWSRAFRCAWRDGWNAGMNDRIDRLFNERSEYDREAVGAHDEPKRRNQRDESADKAVDEYYKDRNNSGQSPLTAHR